MKTIFARFTAISLILIIALLVQTTPAFAQQDRQHNRQQSNQRPGNHEQMEAQRVAFITHELNLTPEEAKVFWPVYNEYDHKRHELKNSFRDADDSHKEDLEKLTEKEASQILDNQLNDAQKLLDLRKEYHNKFKSVLPAVKVLKLYDAEREFQKMLIEKLRHNNSKPPMDKK